MKRFLLMAAVFVSCATRPSADFVAGDADAAVRANAAGFTAAANAANLDDLAAFYGDSAMLLPPNMPAINGRDAIKQYWGGAINAGAAHIELTTDDVMQSGDLAVETGRYNFSLTPKGATTTIKDNGKYVVVWRKSDGKWRIARDIFSSDLPAK
jgi:uncharacterized protein (TIGR02246 family)